MIQIKDGGIILEKTALDFESLAVFNPATILVEGIVHMYYRAMKAGGYSSIGYCQLKDNKVIYRLGHPLLSPEADYEIHGLEDPKITYIDGYYYLFYTAYDGKNTMIAYAQSTNPTHFNKKGLITPNISYEDAKLFIKKSRVREQYFKYGDDRKLAEKNITFFPEKINGKYAILHRILPDLQIIYFDRFEDLTLEYWKDYFEKLDLFIALEPKYHFENGDLGGGCPPIKTSEGWLIIYHSVELNKDKPRIYHACAALLDLNDPTKEIGRLPYPLFSPSQPWEKAGIVPDVVFPTGTVLIEDKLFIYYGAADTLIAAKSVSISSLIMEIKSNSKS